MPPSIYQFIKQEEGRFETEEIQVGENWFWNFKKHVQLIFHLKNGVFFTGENNFLRAFKQVMRPLLRLSYWTEDLEVKDVVFFIESSGGRVLSFLLKKYHDEVYTREHDLDMMFDEITESDIDYGGVLIQKGTERPEVLPLNSIVFCDQTDMMGGPVGFKHYFSPSKLRQMSKFGWGDEKNGATISIDDLCLLASEEKDPVGMQAGKANHTTGKAIEVYIVRGNLPEHYLKDNDDMEYHCNQIQIVAFYTNKKSLKEGVTLYRKEEGESNIKFHASEKIYGRALGYSDGEALIHPQVWTNFLGIHKMGMLEAASKVPLYTDDPTYTQKNKIQDMENLEITTIEDGKRIYQVPTAAVANIQLYENSINELYESAQLNASANDPLLGKEAVSGTTFKGQERTVAQGRGWHDRRRGQRAKFIELIYREEIIPDMVKEINKGKKFLADLSTEELTWIADTLATNEAEKRINDMIFKGQMKTEADKQTLKEVIKASFFKKGNKHLLETLKDEFKGIEVKVGINIAGKQKNLADLSDKVLSIFQMAFADPARFQQAMQIPALAKSFEDILEFSGMSATNFYSLMQQQAPIQATAQPTEAPQLELAPQQ